MTAEQGDSGTDQRCQSRPLRTIPRHNQGEAQAIEGFHRKIHPLVRDQTTQTQADVDSIGIPAKALHLHGGITLASRSL